MKNRIETLLSRLPEEIDAVLITSAVNRRYFTGMDSSAGTLLMIKNTGGYFIIDSRYIEKAQETIAVCEVLLQGKLFEQLDELVRRHGVRKIAVESEYMTVAEFERCKQQLTGAVFLADARVNEAIRKMRMIKSADEVAAIRAAQKITDDAFTHICGYIKEGMTDREIAGELLDYTYRHGSERPAFEYIVVSGKHSSMPHGVPTDKRVERGDFITMDFGCVIEGYCSDMTRTVAVGAVSEEQRQVYNTVLAAHRAAIAAARPGVTGSLVDDAARSLITAAGYGDCFGHSTGHSVGIEIHEPPNFSTSEETLCAAGMVITVEPGIYLAGRFGVRIENMVLITASGCEDLTASDKELLIL